MQFGASYMPVWAVIAGQATVVAFPPCRGRPISGSNTAYQGGIPKMQRPKRPLLPIAFAVVATFLSVLSTGVQAYAVDAEAAEQKTRDADVALKARQYQRAARLYEQALNMWRELAASGANVTDRVRHCRANLIFALSQPLEDGVRRAYQLAGAGKAGDASDLFVKLAARYRKLAERFPSAHFEQNHRYCLSQSYLVLVQAGDDRRSAGKHAEAARLYALARERLDRAKPVLDERQAKQNEAYLLHRLATEQFRRRVAAREPVPELEFTTFDGQIVRLRGYRGQHVVVVFWVAWCKNCTGKLPYLDLLYQALRQRGLAVIGICVDRLPAWDHGTADEAVRFARTRLSFPCVWADDRVMQAFGNPRSVPSVVLIDPDGRLRGAPEADQTHEALSALIRELLETR